MPLISVVNPHWVPGIIETRAATTSQSRAAPGRRTTSPPTTPATSQGAAVMPVSGGKIVVSAVDLPPVPNYRTSETMIFPGSLDGIEDWGELAMIPYKSHADALERIGYTIINEQKEITS